MSQYGPVADNFLRGTRVGVQVKGARNFGPPGLGIGKRYAQLGTWLLP